MTATATTVDRRTLLAVACPWCGASPGEVCTVNDGGSQGQVRQRQGERRRVTTLAGGCHDARWRAAVGVPAPVLSQVVDLIPRHRRNAPVERPW